MLIVLQQLLRHLNNILVYADSAAVFEQCILIVLQLVVQSKWRKSAKWFLAFTPADTSECTCYRVALHF